MDGPNSSTFASGLESRISSTLSGGDTPAAPSSSPSSASSAPSATGSPVPAAPAAAPPGAPASPATSDSPAPGAPAAAVAESAATAEAPPATDEFRFPDEEQPAAPDPNDLGDVTDLGPKEVIDKLLQTPRGKDMYRGYKFVREVAKPPEEGGLGFVPTVEQIGQFQRSHADLELMAHEFHSGDPAYAENFVKQWFSPNEQGQFSPGAQKVAQSFLPTLAKVNPQLYNQAVLPGVLGYVEELYTYARNPVPVEIQTPEGPRLQTEREARIHWLNVARAVESHLGGGKFREIPPEWIDGPAANGNGHDPRAAQIAQQLQYINNFQQQRQTETQQWFAGQVNGAIHQNLTGDVEAALAALKPGMPSKTWTATVNNFRSEVRDAVMKNPVNLRSFVIARDTARQQPTPENIEAAAKAWTAVARPVIKQLRSQYLADAGPKILAQSEARHATLAEAAAKTGTSAIAQPAGGSFGGKLTRVPGASFLENLETATRAAVGAKG